MVLDWGGGSFVVVELGEQLAAFALVAVEAFADDAAEFALGLGVAAFVVIVEFVEEAGLSAFEVLDLLPEAIGLLSVMGVGCGLGCGELGVEEVFAVGAEDAFAEEPVDGVDEGLLAYPQGLGVLVEPVRFAVVDGVFVADEVGVAFAGLTEHPALAQCAVDVGAQQVGGVGFGVGVRFGAAA